MINDPITKKKNARWYDDIEWSIVGEYWISEIVIDASLAHKMLENMAPNRKLRDGAVSGYSTEIDANRWQRNGATIVFNDQGQLLDGQHRLNAIALSDAAVPSLVVFGIPDAAMPTIDSGMMRKSGDALQIIGQVNANSCASAARLHLLYLDMINGSRNMRKVITSEITDHLNRCPELIDAVELVRSNADLRRLTNTAGAVGYAMCKKCSQRDADFFFGRLGDGVSLTVDSQIWVLRRFLNNNKSLIRHIDCLQAIIIAWNAYRRNRDLKLIRIGGTLDYPAPI